MLALALALAAGATAAQAQHIPKQHNFPLYKPPGNVAAGDYKKLFGGAVFVGHLSRGAARVRGVKASSVYVIYMGRNGRYTACTVSKASGYTSTRGLRWKMRRYSRDDRAAPVLVNGRDLSGRKGGHLMPVYDGRTGGLIWYAPERKRWWNIFHGHLQKRLPRAVWTLCPDFPSARSLGVGVNEKQTSGNYSRLLKQDRGQRIIRPDLVTPDPIEYRNPKTGKFELRKGGK